MTRFRLTLLIKKYNHFLPNKLTYIGKINTYEDIYHDWFNKVEIPPITFTHTYTIFTCSKIGILISLFITDSLVFIHLSK